ncbi:hypothetical protein ABID82_002364 [Methylobacterium sp. PvP062]|uniref:Uncharacterized protein n=1 Tax=Methylobacterium radiotolerans TaxID=31998 RepID=A0ABV2NNL1_9HYPH|nr:MULTISPECIES: hypothetical protein [unclassified Methylobacterium]MBP2495304.1 hypothetical protein [Methylobacterium sp. PvP105]MBP2504825.1 hypothetical protein [Methylobacterium sp. PvP109]MCX7335832.1 hypothetical protein [Hyphomicrobiales bacterium]
MGEDGRLGSYPDDRPARDALGTLIVDTDAGTIRGPLGVAQWHIVQQGGDSSDFVASPGLSPSRMITDFIRVRAWKSETNVTFFRVGLTTVISGRCEAIR